MSKSPLFFFVFVFLSGILFARDLFAEGYLGLIYGRNEGKQILETGSKKPDSRGFRGGSRLTYARNFTYFGIEGRYLLPDWLFRARFSTTGWYRNPGTSYNQDFYLFSISSIKQSGLDTSRNRFRDSPYAISGSLDFALARGRTALSEYDVSFGGEWYFQKKSKEKRLGLFLSAALSYAYFKYEVYDVIQWLRTNNDGFLYVPIGVGNSFTNNQLEYPIGIGYAFPVSDFRVQASIEYNNGYNTGKDYHKQRQLNFRIQNTYGNGYNLLLGLEHSFGRKKQWLLAMRLRSHNYYSRGEIGISGGLGNEYVLGLLGAKQGVFLSTKESSGEISILRKL